MDSEMTGLPAASDETVELTLTPEEMRCLSQAAEEARTVPPGRALVVVPSPHIVGKKERALERVRQWPWATIAEWAGATATYGAFAAFAWWGVSTVANQQQPSKAVPIHMTAMAAPPSPLPVQPAAEPMVHVTNPFDSSEVFEFPAGTSAAESREKVAELLMQRARDRHDHWANIKPTLRLRTASL